MLPQSSDLKELFAALAKFQSEMPAVKALRLNPFFKSKYASLTDLWQTAGKLAAQHGLSISQFPLSRDDGKVGVVTYLGHVSGQYICSEFYLSPTKNDPQAAGSALTYARRYAMAAALGLSADEDDDDANAASGQKQNARNTSTNTRRNQSPAVGNATAKSQETVFDKNDAQAVERLKPWLLQKGIATELLPAMFEELNGKPKSAFSEIIAHFTGAL